METKEINILIILEGKLFISAFKKLEEKLKNIYPHIHLYSLPSTNYEEELNKLKDIKFDIFTARPLFVKLTTEILKIFPSIKWVHSLAAGVEKMRSVESLWNNDNIILSNSRGAYSEALGETGITSMLYFSYNIYSYVEKMKNREWSFGINKMLDKKTLLIIGYGNNGVCLAKKAKTFNMKIIAVKKNINYDFPGKEFVDEFYTLENLKDKIINEAHYIYATLPETKETIGIFNKNFFKKMNKDAVFINFGRGNAVVEEDIVEALENNLIRGALLDVTSIEPLSKDSKLYNISPQKLLITDHSLAFTDDIVDTGFEFFYKNLENYIKTGEPLTIVDKKRQY